MGSFYFADTPNMYIGCKLDVKAEGEKLSMLKKFSIQSPETYVQGLTESGARDLGQAKELCGLSVFSLLN